MDKRWAPVWVLLLAACGQPPTTRDAGPDDAGSGFDAGPFDAGPPCASAAECDDGVACTEDVCEDMRCRNLADNTVCSDGIFCNGPERCDVEEGCLVGVRETCNDEDVCSLDRCDEATDSCEHTPRDLDSDGDADWFCGGGDCDDASSAISSLVTEVCDDFVDNDCDEQIDELDCSTPRYDVCADPREVSAGGFFLFSTDGASPDYPTTCGGAGVRELVASFTLTEPRSVSISADGEWFPALLALQSECGALASEIACESGFPAEVRLRSLDAGTYYILAGANFTGEIGLEVTFGPPIAPLTNDTCASPRDVSAGGTFIDSFVESNDDVGSTCYDFGVADLVYTFTTDVEHDVIISAQTRTGDPLAFSVRTACTDDASELRCNYGQPAGGRLHQLAAGTYFLVVEDANSAEAELTLEVEFVDPTPVAPGDTCATAVPLVLGTTTSGSFSGIEDDVFVESCGFRYREIVHSFTLEQSSDVTIEYDAGIFASLSIRTTCEDEATEIRCVQGDPVEQLVRGLPAGTYYLLLEFPRGSSYTVRVDAEPTPPLVDATGNDTCETAIPVPETGGLFRGNTNTLVGDYETDTACGSGAGSPDAAFVLTLTAPARVVANTEASAFDTVLHVHNAMCVDRMESYCDDNGGPDGLTSQIDQMLAAGTWFFVVDGWRNTSRGEYFLEVAVNPP